jgi:hypothetical protein
MDTGVGILGTNMYAYCNNDPVNLWDPDGFAARQGALTQAPQIWPWLNDILNDVDNLDAAGVALLVAVKPVATLVGAGALLVGATAGNVILDQRAPAGLILQEASRNSLDERGVVFFPATLGKDEDPRRNGITVDLSRPMTRADAAKHIREGGDVWTMYRNDANNMARTLCSLGNNPVRGHRDANVRRGIDAHHFHPGTGIGIPGLRQARMHTEIGWRSPHVFYGLQNVRFG